MMGLLTKLQGRRQQRLRLALWQHALWAAEAREKRPLWAEYEGLDGYSSGPSYSSQFAGTRHSSRPDAG